MSGKIHIAFDLGSFSVKGAVAKVNQDKELEIISIQSIKSRAIECGTIVDKEQLVNDLEMHRFMIVLKARQLGISTITGARSRLCSISIRSMTRSVKLPGFRAKSRRKSAFGVEKLITCSSPAIS